jgi:hypothetical protein
MHIALTTFAAVTALALVSCKRTDAPATPAPAAAAPAMPPQVSLLKGKVLERLDVPSYSYLRLKTINGEVWAAVPSCTVEKGAEVTLANPMEMGNFESKTLKRTFSSILFATLQEQSTPVANPHAGGSVPQK